MVEFKRLFRWKDAVRKEEGWLQFITCSLFVRFVQKIHGQLFAATLLQREAMEAFCFREGACSWSLQVYRGCVPVPTASCRMQLLSLDWSVQRWVEPRPHFLLFDTLCGLGGVSLAQLLCCLELRGCNSAGPFPGRKSGEWKTQCDLPYTLCIIGKDQANSDP